MARESQGVDRRFAAATPPGTKWHIKPGTRAPPPGPLGDWLRRRATAARIAYDAVGPEAFAALDHGALLKAADEYGKPS